MLPEKIYLIDFDNTLVEAWIEAFAGDKIFQPICGDYFSVPADGIVSPANSFGFMDGGLDLAIRNVLGFEVENRIKKEIVTKYHGELPIGSALVIPTSHEKWPFMISAPTMRLP